MKNLLLLSLLMAVCILLRAESITIFPSDDMYSDPEHAGTNPTITQLWTANYPSTGHFERIMMKFDLSAIGNAEIESATLHLTRLYSCPASGTTATRFYPITTNWDENTWNYAEHISYDENTFMNYVFIGTGGNAIVDFDIDVKDFIQPWIDGTLENHGFAIVANCNQKFSKFYSKESPAYRPALTIQYSPTANEDELQGISPVSCRNYPNPFNPDTTIEFEMPYAGNAKLTVLNLRGQIVYQQNVTNLSQGMHSVPWNGKDMDGNLLSSGTYYYLIKTPVGTVTKKMTMQK